MENETPFRRTSFPTAPAAASMTAPAPEMLVEVTVNESLTS